MARGEGEAEPGAAVQFHDQQRHHRRQFRQPDDQPQRRNRRPDFRRQHPFAGRRLLVRRPEQPRGRGPQRRDPGSLEQGVRRVRPRARDHGAVEQARTPSGRCRRRRACASRSPAGPASGRPCILLPRAASRRATLPALRPIGCTIASRATIRGREGAGCAFRDKPIMPSLKSLCAFASVVAVCLQLAACGRGSNDLPPSEPPFPAASEDQLPAGQRIDVSAQNLFPMGAGDVWNYNILDAGGTQTGYDTRQVTSGPDASGRVVLTETEAGAPSTTTYVVSGDGLLLAAPLEGFAPASAASIVGSFFEYAAPLYPQGATRRHVRSGPWGEDLDGDGVGESFRLEFSQVFLGFEQVQFSNVFSLKNVAHFRNVIQLTLRPTAPGNTDRAVTVTEETWFAPNLGMLKAVRSAVDIDGVTIDPVHTIAFASATVGGVSWITSARPPILDGQVIDVPVVHNALVYDSVRNRYYASIPGSVIGNGNSIATIEPVTGQVTYSAQIGSNPNAIAISADGSLLYLGLDESGEVVKLALPSMAEVGRTTLVNDNVFGQTRAETIAVSPAEPTVVAVSMAYTGMSPRHAGVALLRDMALQDRK